MSMLVVDPPVPFPSVSVYKSREWTSIGIDNDFVFHLIASFSQRQPSAVVRFAPYAGGPVRLFWILVEPHSYFGKSLIV